LLATVSLCLLGSVSGHMEIKSPAPRKSTFSKYYRSIGDIDYDMNGPLGIFPCKGYKAGYVEYSYNAGDTVQVQFDNGNTHSGGHCQFALSYDNDKTFVVLKTVVRDCFMKGLSFDVPIPATAPPSKRATLAWTWVNAVGNREYYMNCIDITIKGGVPGGTITGPKLMVANLPGYPTIPE
ncbi:putative endoglucanase precursor, partial [Basidiobolus meristosporus CBS 931.73]